MIPKWRQWRRSKDNENVYPIKKVAKVRKLSCPNELIGKQGLNTGTHKVIKRSANGIIFTIYIIL